MHIPNFIPGIAFALVALAFPHRAQASLANTGYSDNPCIAKYVAGKFKDYNGEILYDQGYPTLSLVYSYTCKDGGTYTEAVERHMGELFTLVGSAKPINHGQGDPIPTLAYDQSRNMFQITAAWYGQLDHRAYLYELDDPFLKKLEYNYVIRLGNPKVITKNVQFWTTEAEAQEALQMKKYDPVLVKVEQIFKTNLPAFPQKNGRDDMASKIPRPFLRLTWTGSTGSTKAPDKQPPKYFATVYCFQGQGDADMFNRPAIVSDAFDPGNERGAWDIKSNVKFKALLAQYDKANGKGRNSPRAVGYDMFYVDYSQGAGNLLINSALFLKFVEWMHSATPHPMIVGGPSMGGQIPRLALLYSIPENNVAGRDLATRVKGYLAIDSPHQGASISGSLQQSAHNLANNSLVNAIAGFVGWISVETKNTAIEQWNQLCAPASHQMLYEHWYPGVGSSKTTSHDGFYAYLKALGSNNAILGDKRGYRSGIPMVSIATSNFYAPVPGYDETKDAIMGDIKVKAGATIAEVTWRAGGPKGSPRWQEFSPGSTGNWYFGPYKREAPTFFIPAFIGPTGNVIRSAKSACADPVVFNVPENEYYCRTDGIQNFTLADYQMGETFAGTFMPIASALDLTGFDVMSPPTFNELEIAKYSPFDAVYYMREDFNGYGLMKEPAQAVKFDRIDRRYEHIIFDQQVMTAVMAGLHDIEDRYQRKVTGLPSYEGGYAHLTLTGFPWWQSVPRAYPAYDFGRGQLTGWNVNNIPMQIIAPLVGDGRANAFEGDFNGDRLPDVLVTQGYLQPNHLLSYSDGWTNLKPYLAPGEEPGLDRRTKVNLADFNNDSFDDIVFLANPERAKMTLSLAKAAGGFTNIYPVVPAAFIQMANFGEVKVATGDFNHDANFDIALVGGNGWTSIPILLGNGAGAFTYANWSAPAFARQASKKGAIIIAAGFKTDIQKGLAVLADNEIVTATRLGNVTEEKTFVLTSPTGQNFVKWAQEPGARLVAADFNGDGRTDLSVTGAIGTKATPMTAIPVAFANGDGSFKITEIAINGFEKLARAPNVRVKAMDINQDMRADLVLTGPKGWGFIASALSKGDGSFTVQQFQVSGFPDWAAHEGVKEFAFPIHAKR